MSERLVETTSGVVHPPVWPLQSKLMRLRDAGLVHALGGSALLGALGLATRANDWDVTVDADVEALRRVFEREPCEYFGNSGCHADHKLTWHDERIELIPRMAFFAPDGIVRIPTVVTRKWAGLPVGSPAAWYAAYWLLGALEKDDRRFEKAAQLAAWIAEHGADAAGVSALLAEPLPAELRAAIEAFPLAAG